MTKLTLNFDLEDFLFSQTASRLGFSEQFKPSKEVLDNLQLLANGLEVVRGILGSAPVFITSGYRCPRLNEAVHGASDSAHMLGLAADIRAPKFGTPVQICRRIGST